MTDEKPDQHDAVERLERQTARGSVFTHRELRQIAERHNLIEAFLYGLADALMAKGLLSAEEIEIAAQAVKAEMQDSSQTAASGVLLRETDPQPGEPVNCSERMHLCKAVCCRLHFTLSAEEVEGGKVKWDLGQPYRIRHEQDGYCTHIDRETLRCNTYEHRPAVCRSYSCRHDTRIWKDFEAMELNDEWLTANLNRTRAYMIPLDSIPVSPAKPK
jgi:Fe-S-cluster containining protein